MIRIVDITAPPSYLSSPLFLSSPQLFFLSFSLLSSSLLSGPFCPFFLHIRTHCVYHFNIIFYKFKNIHLLVWENVYDMYMGTHILACIGRSEDNFVETILFFHLHVGFRKWTWVARFSLQMTLPTKLFCQSFTGSLLRRRENISLEAFSLFFLMYLLN